jgi:hypothetical protein
MDRAVAALHFLLSFIFLDFFPDTHTHTAEWYMIFGFHADGYVWWMSWVGLHGIPKGKTARRFL